MAEYRDRHADIRAAGAQLAAISVDGPAKSETVRRQLHLSFAILCDTERQVVRRWGLYNQREKGGIAKPSVFIIDPGRVVRSASVDEIASRVPAAAVLRALAAGDRVFGPRSRLLPGPATWTRAVRNSFYHGVRQPPSGAK